MTRTLKIGCAALALALQLYPVALPALCGPDPAPAAGCEQPMAPRPPAGGAVSVPTQTSPCPSAALCGVPATAVAALGALEPAVTSVELDAFFSVALLRQGESPAPLAPPPLA